MPESTTYTYGGTPKFDLDQQLDRALSLTSGDSAAAARLFMRWAEGDSEIYALIPPVVEDFIKKRIGKRAKVAPK